MTQETLTPSLKKDLVQYLFIKYLYCKLFAARTSKVFYLFGCGGLKIKKQKFCAYGTQKFTWEGGLSPLYLTLGRPWSKGLLNDDLDVMM